MIRSEEVNRVELQLGDGESTGYLRTPAGLAPLPIGSRLDRATNTFTWAPGVGFVGRYDFVFVRSANGRAVSRREVRIVLHPKGRGSVGPQVVIDVPRANAAVEQPFMIGGWAVDLDAREGTGVTPCTRGRFQPLVVRRSSWARPCMAARVRMSRRCTATVQGLGLWADRAGSARRRLRSRALRLEHGDDGLRRAEGRARERSIAAAFTQEP